MTGLPGSCQPRCQTARYGHGLLATTYAWRDERNPSVMLSVHQSDFIMPIVAMIGWMVNTHAASSWNAP